MPELMISATQFPASSFVLKPINTARTDWGFFNILTVISVMTPNNPSDPVIIPNRSYPSGSKFFPPSLIIVPSIKTISTPRTLLVVTPYFNEWTPPALVEIFPPIEQANWLDGSGA